MILSVSIDLDPLCCYREIYGLGPAGDSPSADPVTPVAAERFCELAGSLGLCGTLFVVATKWPTTASPIPMTCPGAIPE
jgi:hypothetical protein